MALVTKLFFTTKPEKATEFMKFSIHNAYFLCIENPVADFAFFGFINLSFVLLIL